MTTSLRRPFPVLALVLAGCGGVPSFHVSVELSVECAAGTSCAQVAPVNSENPIYKGRREAGPNACLTQGANGMVYYRVTQLNGQAQQFSGYGGGVIFDTNYSDFTLGFAVSPHELHPDFDTLYTLDSYGVIHPSNNPGPAQVAIGDGVVVARYPSRQQGRVIVETHRIVQEANDPCGRGINWGSGWGR